MIELLTLRALVLRVLRDELQVLGKYYLDGDCLVDDAIAVLPDEDLGMNYPPANTQIKGVEAVIMIPMAGAEPLMGAHLMKRATWEVRLKQWDRSKNLIEVSDLLVNAINAEIPCLMKNPMPIPYNEKLGTPEQLSIRFSEYRFS